MLRDYYGKRNSSVFMAMLFLLEQVIQEKYRDIKTLVEQTDMLYQGYYADVWDIVQYDEWLNSIVNNGRIFVRFRKYHNYDEYRNPEEIVDISEEERNFIIEKVNEVLKGFATIERDVEVRDKDVFVVLSYIFRK